MLESALGRALYYEVLALAVLSIFTLGWYFAGFGLVPWLR